MIHMGDPISRNGNRFDESWPKRIIKFFLKRKKKSIDDMNRAFHESKFKAYAGTK